MKKIIICLLLTLTLTGCLQKTELRDRAIAQCFGVDYEDGEYKISMQIFNNTLSDGGVNSVESNSTVVTATGETITAAMYNLNGLLGKSVFLGNNKVILIGKDTAKNGINDIIGFFNSDYQTRAKTYVIICDRPALDVVNAKDEDKIIPARKIVSVVELNKNSGIIGESDILTAEIAMNSEADNAYLLGYLTLEEVDEKLTHKIIGSAVMKKGKLVDVLDEEESRGAVWVNGGAKLTYVNAEVDGKKVTVTAQKPKTKIKSSLENNRGRFLIDVKFEGKLAEIMQNKTSGVNLDELKKIEKSVEEHVLEEIEEAIQKGVEENGCDIFDFDSYLSMRHKDFVMENKENWEDKIKEFDIEVNVDCVLKRPAMEAKNS